MRGQCFAPRDLRAKSGAEKSEMPETSILTYEPLPQAALMAVCDGLVQQGYERQAILEDYIISGTQQEHLKINALAFAHAEHRNPADYAGVTVFNAANGRGDPEIVRKLAQSFAPFHLIHRRGRLSFWGSAVDLYNQVVPLPVESDISYENLAAVLQRYHLDLTPVKLIQVKRGLDSFTSPIFRDIQPLQLSLWAQNVTRKGLVCHFAAAVNDLRGYSGHREEQLSDTAVTDLAIQLLGACILSDTGVLGPEMRADDVDPIRLVRRAHEKFGRYFDPRLFTKHVEAAEHAFRLMRDVSYAGFTPDMLTGLVKAAYTQDELKTHGRYDTPLYLTRRIWENIPVEFLHPERRVVADMSCGWGSFLIAGYERLSVLSDARESLTRRGIIGNEEAPFTARVAGLGLLLSTSVDHWHVDSGDALQWRWLRANQPGIIVGNPPFSGRRDAPKDGATSREQKADPFLSLAIDRLAPGGYLAMIMPMSFVAAEASPALRQKLLDQCDLTEIWEFPGGVFHDAKVHAVVLFARKKPAGGESIHAAVQARTVQKNTLPAFRVSPVFTVSPVVDQASFRNQGYRSDKAKTTDVFSYKLVLPSAAWDSVRSRCVNLEEVVELSQGATVGTPNPRRTRHTEPRAVMFLRRFKAAVPSDYRILYETEESMQYPADFEEPRENHRDLLLGAKVVLPAVSNPHWGKKLTVAIERQGYCVSHTFWAMAPTPKAAHNHVTLEVIAAVLDWCVANAWILEHIKSTFVPSYSLRTLPFPSGLSEEDCGSLKKAVQSIEAATRNNQPDPPEARAVIDAVLRRAYHLDGAAYERLSNIYYSRERANQPVSFDKQPAADPDAWITTGVVFDVDVAKATVTLWLEDFDDLYTTPITPAMPGWMLRPKTSFRTTIPDRCVQERSLETVVWGRFVPQPNTYMSEVELLESISAAIERTAAVRA